jgi:hypothetical protein
MEVHGGLCDEGKWQNLFLGAELGDNLGPAFLNGGFQHADDRFMVVLSGIAQH